MARLTDQEIARALEGLPGWSREGEALLRTVGFPSFPDAVAFLVRVAFEAEAADHHPDVSLHYRQVTLRYWTHTEGGITARDVEGARVADRVAAAWKGQAG